MDYFCMLKVHIARVTVSQGLSILISDFMATSRASHLLRKTKNRGLRFAEFNQ